MDFDICPYRQENTSVPVNKGSYSLNVIGPHNLTGSGTISRCGFVGVGMALLKEVLGADLEVSYAQDTTQCLSQLPVACKK